MKPIADFREVRRDGRIIGEHMTVDKMLAEGWQPDLVTCVQWHYDSRLIELRHRSGLLAKLVPDRSAVVVLVGDREDSPMTDLYVVNPDGTKRLSISNTQTVNGIVMVGTFGWFENARTRLPTAFGVAFQGNQDSRMFQLDFDAMSGALLEVSQIR